MENKVVHFKIGDMDVMHFDYSVRMSEIPTGININVTIYDTHKDILDYGEYYTLKIVQEDENRVTIDGMVRYTEQICQYDSYDIHLEGEGVVTLERLK